MLKEKLFTNLGGDKVNRLELSNFTLNNEKNTIPATVPGDITVDLFRAELIEDPFYGDNFKRLGWIHESDWTYSTHFVVSELIKQRTYELVFEGIDLFSEIYLNGKLLGKTDNAFKKYTFNVVNILLQGDNFLQIKMLSTYRVIQGLENPCVKGLFNEKRYCVRKMQCSFGWDWSPNFIGYGICGKVYLEEKNERFMRDLNVKCDADGSLFFNVEVNDFNNCTLKITTNGESTCHQLFSNSTSIDRFVTNPLLWYPNGYGEPNLYAYSVELLYNDKCVDKKSGVLGFRKIEIEQTKRADDSVNFAFVVNGKKIFAKGSNFVPITTLSGCADESEYEILLSYAKQAGYNMIRVWGGGIYEKEIFYSLCDRYGIIVWQDFMLSCSQVSALDFYKNQIKQEAYYQISRLNAHPSVCIWCGGNEMWYGSAKQEQFLKEELLEICKTNAPSCVYLPNSPFSIEKDIWDKTTGDNHVSCFEQALLEDNVKGFRDNIYKNKSNFYTECTILGSSRIRSLKKFLPKDKLWPTNEIWDEHFVTNPYGLNPEETFVLKEKRLASGLYGEISSLESFVKKSQLAQADILRAEIDFARGNSEDVSGHLNWMYNDIWGCGTWSLIDKYMERKPAYFAQKRAFYPFVVNLTKEENGYYVNIVNDREIGFEGELKLADKKLDGSVINSYNSSVKVGPRSIKKILLSPDIRKGDYLTLCAGEYKTIYLQDDQSELTFVSNLTVKKERLSERSYKLKIRANAFAKCVFVDIPYTVLDITDNYFDMEEGEEKIIIINSSLTLNGSDITVLTYADEWVD